MFRKDTKDKQRRVEKAAVKRSRSRNPRDRDDDFFWAEEGRNHHSRERPKKEYPFVLQDGLILNKRADAWLYLLLASCVTIAALVNLDPSNLFNHTQCAVCIVVASISLFVSIIAAFGYRHTSVRNLLTRGVLCRIETLLSILLFILWCAGAAICLNGSNRLAAGATTVLDTNLFFGTWLCFGLSTYLAADATASTIVVSLASYRGRPQNQIDKREAIAARFLGGTCPLYDERLQAYICHGYDADHSFKVLWCSLLVSSSATAASAANIRSGPMCDGPILSGTSSCQSAMVMLMLGVLNGIVCVAAIGWHIVCLLKRGNKLEYSRPRRAEKVMGPTLALISTGLIIAAAVIGTTPGEMGSDTSNLFVSLWTSVVLTLVLCGRYLREAGRAPLVPLPPPVAKMQSTSPPRSRRRTPPSRDRHGRGSQIQTVPTRKMEVRSASTLGSAGDTDSSWSEEQHDVIETRPPSPLQIAPVSHQMAMHEALATVEVEHRTRLGYESDGVSTLGTSVYQDHGRRQGEAGMLVPIDPQPTPTSSRKSESHNSERRKSSDRSRKSERRKRSKSQRSSSK